MQLNLVKISNKFDEIEDNEMFESISLPDLNQVTTIILRKDVKSPRYKEHPKTYFSIMTILFL